MSTATNTATIEVKFANPPKNGKKLATVKTAAGDIFGVWPDKLGLLRPGCTYQVEYSERAHQGRTYRTITKCTAQKQQTNGSPDNAVPGAPDREFEFVVRGLTAAIGGKAVDVTPEALGRAVTALRSAYRSAFGG